MSTLYTTETIHGELVEGGVSLSAPIPKSGCWVQ